MMLAAVLAIGLTSGSVNIPQAHTFVGIYNNGAQYVNGTPALPGGWFGVPQQHPVTCWDGKTPLYTVTLGASQQISIALDPGLTVTHLHCDTGGKVLIGGKPDKDGRRSPAVYIEYGK